MFSRTLLMANRTREEVEMLTARIAAGHRWVSGFQGLVYLP